MLEMDLFMLYKAREERPDKHIIIWHVGVVHISLLIAQQELFLIRLRGVRALQELRDLYASGQCGDFSEVGLWAFFGCSYRAASTGY